MLARLCLFATDLTSPQHPVLPTQGPNITAAVALGNAQANPKAKANPKRLEEAAYTFSSRRDLANQPESTKIQIMFEKRPNPGLRRFASVGLFALLIGLMLPPVSDAHAMDATCDTITVSSHSSYPPYSYLKDDVLVGAAIELIELIGQDIGVGIDVRNIGPWMRAITTLRDGGIDLLTTVYYVPERLGDLAYTHAYVEDPIVVFTVGADEPALNDRNDLIGLAGITTRGESRGEEFDTFMAKELNIMIVNSPDQIINMLDQNRADYGLQGLYSLKEAQKRNPIDKKLWITDVPIDAAQICMAFSINSPCTKWIPAINAEIDRRIADGTVTELMVKHGAISGY
jgi:polar amino acid transport system substrate-binding protein